MTKIFPEIKERFGFGCMRLPMKGNEVDYPQFCEMVDAFLAAGFNYFDTAHGYIEGKSETAIRDCLVKRHPRNTFLLVNKLTNDFFNSEEEIRPFFERQLELCGVEYFDFYLMHAQNKQFFEKYKKCKAYETAFKLKEEGKVKHVGLSFHDSWQVLDDILTTYPQIEIVQIQFNYEDYDSAEIQSRACYEVCLKHNKPVIVMEPVKGGILANLPKKAEKIFDQLKGGSYASYALRFAANFSNVIMILSGMSNIEQMRDNLSFMKDVKPLTKEESDAINKVKKVFDSLETIPCTACKYCVPNCVKNIPIPEILVDLNFQKRYANVDSSWRYNIHTQNKGKASDCIKCGKCESACPQHLSIREYLNEAQLQFEIKKN